MDGAAAATKPVRAMQGVLFRYGRCNQHLAFASGVDPSRHTRHVILMSGLTEGLMGVAFAEPLAAALESRGWTLVQAQLSSSYAGYGTSCLDRDAEEVRMLMRVLRSEYGCKGVAIVGHSTGSQIVTRFMQQLQQRQQAAAPADGPGGSPVDDLPPVLATVLHSAVSDREAMAGKPRTVELAAAAEKMVADGKGQDIVGRLRWQEIPDPITADRLLSLCARGGDDDMFSSDLSDAELTAMLSPLGAAPCLVLQGGADECFPSHVDVEALTKRLAAAAGEKCRGVVIPGANHAKDGHTAEVTAHICELLDSAVAQGGQADHVVA